MTVVDDLPIDIEEPPNEPAPAKPSLLGRVGRRIIRRPSRWLNAPWPTERIVQYLTALVLVGGATFAVFQVVHLDLVLTNNTPTGGDMGAHVMAPAFLRDVLLPNGQLSGWSMYWYAGFPMYRFYMVVPALLIVGLNALWIPYGVAFKIVAVLGLVTLPFCCWAFGRLARFRYPIPELMALGGMLFLFDESFSIYGGNVKSTMAGEFSFSIALSLAVLGFGLFAGGLQSGRYRSWSAIVLALAILSHGVVAIYVVLGAVLLWLVYMDKTRFRYGLGVLGGTALLSAFWIVPFLFNHQYMTDMKYGFRPDGPTDSFWKMFFQYPPFWDLLVNGLAIVGFAFAIARRQLVGVWLGLMCLALMALTYVTRDSLPVIGLLWNPRLLPFLYITRLLLAMVGVVELVRYVVRNAQGVRHLGAKASWITGLATAATVGVTVLIVVLFIFREVPGGHYSTKNGKSVYSWGIGGWDVISLTPTSEDAVSDGWTRYNFEGYEGRPAYGEYRALIDTMAQIGADPNLGCGRAIWENNNDTGAYGTTMSLMLLPHWTDGCITSMEGLYFEASGTTPYHFLTAAAISSHSSDPVRELHYDDGDTAKGVPYMQALGVNYLMVFTQEAKDQADALTQGADPQLTKIASSGPWNIYQVADSPLVQPLTVQPVVVNPRGGDQRERHLELGTSWFQHRDEWAAMPADGGPADWQRIDVVPDATRNDGKTTGQAGHKVDIVVPKQQIEPVDLPQVTVSNVHLGDQDVSFDVDKVGVPVLVKVSYFPNWEVSGAEGPWRIGPNMMVVVPTENHVRLHFERSTLDDVSYLLTLIGIVLLVFFRIHGDVRHRGESPFDPQPVLATAEVAPATAAAEPPPDQADDWPWLSESSDPSPPAEMSPEDADPTVPVATGDEGGPEREPGDG
ncbi:MAG: 6-pyruvoyl-tetrahydropterin synthase-related protein [Ilumatobacteraceae bacterium]